MTQETPDGVPISDGFDFPVGKPDAAGYYVAAGLVDEEYFKLQNGAWHPGEDWNARTGGDSDLGAPVYAISNGKVIWADYNPKSWGNIVLIEHALPDGTRVWSQYAHLNQVMVSNGQKVGRGQQIGGIGKGANNMYVAHLHFEIRKNNLTAGNWTPIVKDRNQVLANYHYPSEFIKTRRPGMLILPTVPVGQPQVQPPPAPPAPVTPPPPPQPAVQPIQIIVESQRTDPKMGRFRRAKTDNWYTAPAGAYSSMLWTPVSASQESAWGEWHPFLPVVGRWEVSAFVGDLNATTANAHYRITHADGQAEVSLNQDKYNNTWVSLGVYQFESGQGAVRLSNLTGENSPDKKVSFDAMRWARVG